MLKKGITGNAVTIVTEENTAAALKSGDLRVFATPAMIALIEEAAWKSVAEELEEGMATVGTQLTISHLSATPVGMKVTCRTTLTEIDGRKLVFEVSVSDETGEVGNGTHERFLVQADKFQSRADAKK